MQGFHVCSLFEILRFIISRITIPATAPTASQKSLSYSDRTCITLCKCLHGFLECVWGRSFIFWRNVKLVQQHMRQIAKYWLCSLRTGIARNLRLVNAHHNDVLGGVATDKTHVRTIIFIAKVSAARVGNLRSARLAA